MSRTDDCLGAGNAGSQEEKKPHNVVDVAVAFKPPTSASQSSRGDVDDFANNNKSEANTNNKICCGNNGFTAHRGGYIKRYECSGVGARPCGVRGSGLGAEGT